MTSPSFIPFALPDLSTAEIDAVTDVLRSSWITTGPRAKEFEATFAAAVDAPQCVAVNSCTAALHLALEAARVRPGDEVIVPTMTFAASAEVVRYLGATPVLVDVRASDHNVDVGAIQRAITNRTRAILPVHFGGVPADMDEIVALARTRDLAVIADAAHAFPCRYKGRNVGTLADVTCFSFYATKTITTGEGGAAVTARQKWAERMRIMSLHGISRDAWKRYMAEGSWYYEIVAPGFKYNLGDIAAALGVAQLARADAMRARRAAIAGRYDDAFGGEETIELLRCPPDRTSAHHLYVVKLAPHVDRNGFIEQLRARGIGASVHFIPLHEHPYYRETYGFRPESLPVAHDAFRRSVSLPLYSAMTDEQVDRVIRTVLALAGAQRPRAAARAAVTAKPARAREPVAAP
jgi:perosamine synthetase